MIKIEISNDVLNEIRKSSVPKIIACLIANNQKLKSEKKELEKENEQLNSELVDLLDGENVTYKKQPTNNQKLPDGWHDVEEKTPSNNGDICSMALYNENGRFWGFCDGYYEGYWVSCNENVGFATDENGEFVGLCENNTKEVLTVKYWRETEFSNIEFFKKQGEKQCVE